MEESKRFKKKKSFKILLVIIGIILYLFGLAIGVGFIIKEVIIPELKPISVEEVKDSVVMIKTYNEHNQEYGQGSGFSFKESNVIITNFHVLAGAKRIEIITDDGQTYNIENIKIFDKKNDLALIEGNFELKPVAYTSAHNMSEKDEITTISSPQGAFNTISQGTIRKIYQDATEILVSIEQGSSGGAVLNKKGRIFAIIVAKLSLDTNENLAINIDLAEILYNKYKNDKYAIIENNPDDIHSFQPNIFDDKDGNELTIMDKWSKNKTKVYQPNSLVTFNNLTSGYSIFNQAMIKKNDDFSKIYLGLSSAKKILVVDYYKYLKAYDQWWFSEDNIEFDETVNLRKDKIEDWSDEQLLIDLGVMERYQLAILGAITRDLIYYEDFVTAVKGLPIEEGKKGILLLTFGDNEPRELSNKQNNLIKEFISKALNNDEEKIPKVLKRLGY